MNLAQAIPLLLPVTVPAGVKVWQLELSVDASLSEAALALLDPQEQAYCQRFRQPADRARFALTRVALKQLLAAHLGIAIDQIALHKGPRGKPQLARGDAPHFNVSHAGGYALIAISDQQPVGVDIEQLGAAGLELAPQICALAEQQYLLGQLDQWAAFHALWVAKEAVLKAWGWGLDDRVKRLSTLPGQPSYQLAWDGQPLTATHAWPLAISTGYLAALALGTPA